MAQVQDLKTDEEFDIGPVSGTLAGAPAPLPDAVVFLPSGPITLVPIDAVSVTVKAAGAGAYSVQVTCDGLQAEEVSGNISENFADALVVPVGAVRKQA